MVDVLEALTSVDAVQQSFVPGNADESVVPAVCPAVVKLVQLVVQRSRLVRNRRVLRQRDALQERMLVGLHFAFLFLAVFVTRDLGLLRGWFQRGLFSSEGLLALRIGRKS